MHSADEEYTSGTATERLLNRNFVLLFCAFFAFAAANQALIPALPIYFTRLGSSESQVGTLVGIMGIAALVTRLFMGGFLARISEKRAILLGALLFSMTFPASFLCSGFWSLFIVRVFQGAAFACCHTAALSYVINATPVSHRGQGIAYFMLAPNLALATAAPAGMFVINKFGFIPFFLGCTALALCCFSLSFKVESRKQRGVIDAAGSMASAFVPAWKVIVPALANFLQIFVYGALAAFIPLYAIQRGISNPGLFFGACAVAMMAGRLFGGRILDTFDKEKLMMILLSICTTAMIILSLSTTLPMFIFVGLLWGIGASFFMPACLAYALEYAGSSDGASVGTFQAFVDLGVALGPVVAGIFVRFTGYPLMFLCLSGVCVIDLIYLHFYVRKHRKASGTAPITAR